MTTSQTFTSAARVPEDGTRVTIAIPRGPYFELHPKLSQTKQSTELLFLPSHLRGTCKIKPLVSLPGHTSRNIFPFLKLPRELRDQIYHNVTFHDHVTVRDTDHGGTTKILSDSPLLMVNRQTQEEYEEILRKNEQLAVNRCLLLDLPTGEGRDVYSFRYFMKKVLPIRMNNFHLVMRIPRTQKCRHDKATNKLTYTGICMAGEEETTIDNMAAALEKMNVQRLAIDVRPAVGQEFSEDAHFHCELAAKWIWDQLCPHRRVQNVFRGVSISITTPTAVFGYWEKDNPLACSYVPGYMRAPGREQFAKHLVEVRAQQFVLRIAHAARASKDKDSLNAYNDRRAKYDSTKQYKMSVAAWAKYGDDGMESIGTQMKLQDIAALVRAEEDKVVWS